MKDTQVEFVVDSLCTNMVSGKEQLRDISSIGLKTVITELSGFTTSPLVANICRRVTGKLTNTVAKTDDVSVQLEALEILGDLLTKYGGKLLVGSLIVVVGNPWTLSKILDELAA